MRTALAATTLLSSKPILSLRASPNLGPNDSLTGSHYAMERDRLTQVALNAALAQHAPELRAPEMHGANARSAQPLELPFTAWPRLPGAG
jgi:hypothetical protein